MLNFFTDSERGKYPLCGGVMSHPNFLIRQYILQFDANFTKHSVYISPVICNLYIIYIYIQTFLRCRR